MPTIKPWSARYLLTVLLLVLVNLGLATTAHAFGSTDCAADRSGSDLNCTANDLLVSNIRLAAGSSATCFSGQTTTVDLIVNVTFGGPDRYDVGIFFPANDFSAGVNQQKTSANGGPTACSVKTLPVPPAVGAFENLNGNACGDGGNTITSQDTTLQTVTLPCRVAPGSGGNLSIPYVVTYTQSAGATCNGPDDAVAGTRAKCNAPSGANASVPVVVVPNVAITDGKTHIDPGAVNTYTVTVTNSSGATVTGAYFKLPQPGSFTFTGTPTCNSTIGTTCPSGLTTTSIQSWIALADMPNGSSLTFSIDGTLSTSATGTLNTTAYIKIGVGGTEAPITDTDTIDPLPTSAANSTVVASPTSVASDNSSTSTITVTLKDTAGNLVAGKTITLTAGAGSSTITTVSGTTDVNGQASFTVKDAVQESVTYTATDATDNIVITQTATVTFSSVSSFNAFETSTTAAAISGSIYTKLAGTGFGLDVVAIAGSSKAASFSGDVKVELLANSGTAGSGYDATSRCPTSGTVITGSTIASTAIASGRSTVNFAAVAGAYRDVRVRISYPTGASPSIVVCSNDSFAIRPPTFTITSTDATNNGVAGTPVIKAGVSFNLTATAVAGYDGTPSIDATPTMQLVGSPTPGTLAGSFGAASIATGVATGNAFTYSEVGNFGLKADSVYDANFTGVDQPSDCTDNFSNILSSDKKYGCKLGSTAVPATLAFGRFIPDHFAITSPASLEACAPFTYFGQDGFTTTFTLTAQNVANATTVNYAGVGNAASRAKLPLTTWGAAPATAASPGFGFAVSAWAPSQPAGAAIAASATAPTASNASKWVAGTTTVTARHMITRPTNPAVPNTVTVSALPVDSDGVTMAAAATLGTSLQRFGILRLDNAYGSELLPIRVTARAMYCNAVSGANCTQWNTNTDDACTSFTPANGTLANYQAPASVTNPLASTNFRITGTNPNTATGGTGNWTAASVTTNSGTGTIILSKPCVGGPGAACSAAVGSVDMTLDLSAGLPWLQGSWTSAGAWNQNPTARLKFGSPKAPYIYLRERY